MASDKEVMIVVGHNLYDEGVAFACTMQGTARRFDTVEDAQTWIQETNGPDHRKIWSVFVLAELVIPEYRRGT